MIESKNVSEENRYIQSVVLNGEALSKPWFTHSDIVKGGGLSFVVGPEPNKKWGSASKDAPPSLSQPR